MVHIKRLVIHGFKSFARKIEIPFNKGINVVIGPNGSGKSNISDAICFALGRLSIKSMRAEKSKNLIFMGSKYEKPAHEASVEIVFDNLDRTFGIDKDEVSLKRIVRINGQGIYKINEETKTRVEVIEILGQAGIDPYGFNIILQGQIQSIVRIHPEERRKIIGEVAGISVYEWRKEKSLKELEKTEERLKEISTILRERAAYLNNLEKEKSQAQRYQELQLIIKRARASILKKKRDEKKREIDSIVKAIEEKVDQKDKRQEKADKTEQEIDSSIAKVSEINSAIRKATGVEQGRLREEITNAKVELESLRVRREAYEYREQELRLRIDELQKSIPSFEKEISQLKKESPLIAVKSAELKKKKEEMVQLEKERKTILALKAEVEGIKSRIEDKKRQLTRSIAEVETITSQIEEMSAPLKYHTEKECSIALNKSKNFLAETKKIIEEIEKNEKRYEKQMSLSESEIKRNEEVKKKVSSLEICPLCQSKITQEHINHVYEDSEKNIIGAKEENEKARLELEKVYKEKNEKKKAVDEEEQKIRIYERDLITLKTISEKSNAIKDALNYQNILKKEIDELDKRKNSLETKISSVSNIEEKYSNALRQIEEISSRTEKDIDTSLLFKERELEKIKEAIERNREDLGDIQQKISDISSTMDETEEILQEREQKEKDLNERFKKMFIERDTIQTKINEFGIKLSELQNEIRQIEDQINYLKIGKAKIEGECQTIEIDLADYVGIELLSGSIQHLEERLAKAQESISNIGSINMRALEVYDEIKKEYDLIKGKAETIEKEKLEIMKIIEEIDKKKKRTFMKTFNAINELFTSNFTKLSAKGQAFLEIENKEDIFAGGVEIVVRMAKGKYFDTSSLSGGEQTLVALSLLFAIQEYKPYHFYILDEIDAALDKRNSERLAALLKKYMKTGQYIIVTHNDALILDADILYGVSMHEGVSKVLSLKISADDKSEI